MQYETEFYDEKRFGRQGESLFHFNVKLHGQAYTKRQDRTSFIKSVKNQMILKRKKIFPGVKLFGTAHCLIIRNDGEVRILIGFSQKETKEETVERILLENYNRYYRLAYSYVHNDADASDIVQNGAYKAILNSGSLRKQEFAATWIYRIMLNEIFRSFDKRVTVSFEEVCVEVETEDSYTDTDLMAALETLTKEDKAVIELRFFEEMKLEEIAEILNENRNTVKSRLYRGLRKLRLKLEDDGAGRNIWQERGDRNGRNSQAGYRMEQTGVQTEVYDGGTV